MGKGEGKEGHGNYITRKG